MVSTSPHGEGDVREHINTEYDPDSDGLIDGSETDINHGELNDAPAEAHHNQVDDESGTFNVASGGAGPTTVNFGQAYATGVGEAGMKGISPLSGDATVVAYTTNANGNLDGMKIRYENTGAAGHTVEWRFAGRPV